MLTSATILRGTSAPLRFAVLFLVGALGACVSLVYLRRVPDVDAPDAVVRSGMRVPWRDIMRHPPFLRLNIYTALFMFAVGSMGVFNVAFMKTRFGFSESRVLYLSTLYFVAAMMTLPFVGRVLDRVGSKIVLSFALALHAVTVFGWALLAFKVISPSLGFVGLIIFVSGIAGSNFGLAHVRMVMNTMPAMGRSHFFALFSVISSLILGVTPIIWGVLLDALDRFEAVTGALHWNKYSVYYFLLLLLVAAATLLTATLHEPKKAEAATATARDSIISERIRRFGRFWQR
jgi:MFS family permease